MSQLWRHEAVHLFQVCCCVDTSFGVGFGLVVSNFCLRIVELAALMVGAKHLRLKFI